MEKFTGRYSFRQGNKPDALPDTTIAARGVHHGSGDRHNVHDGGSANQQDGACRDGIHVLGKRLDRYGNGAGDMTLFKFFRVRTSTTVRFLCSRIIFIASDGRQGAGVRVSFGVE